jgi:hypothetical protein
MEFVYFGGFFMTNYEELDIMGNIKLIDNYKNLLLSTVADLFMSMGTGSKVSMDEINDELSETIILSYLLGKRLSIDFNDIDERITRKLKLGIASDEGNGDFSKLIAYIKNGRSL